MNPENLSPNTTMASRQPVSPIFIRTVFFQTNEDFPAPMPVADRCRRGHPQKVDACTEFLALGPSRAAKNVTSRRPDNDASVDVIAGAVHARATVGHEISCGKPLHADRGLFWAKNELIGDLFVGKNVILPDSCKTTAFNGRRTVRRDRAGPGKHNAARKSTRHHAQITIS